MAYGDIYSPGGGIYDPSGAQETDEERQRRREAGLDPMTGQPTGQAGTPAYDANPRDFMIQRDREQWRNRLRGVAQGLNFGDWEKAAEEELQGVERAVSYAQNAGQDPDVYLKEAEARLRRRGAPSPGGATNVPGGGTPPPSAGPSQPSQPSPQQSVYTGSTSPAISGEGALGDLYRYLRERDQAAAQERASMREILLSQLGEATRPVDVTDPTLQRILGPQRVQLQRSAERQRSQAMARLAAENLADSGTADTMLNAIEQQRGEAAAALTGRVLSQELSARRDQVARLLQLAVQTGDAEAARTLSGQLNLINQQLGQEQAGNELGYRYSALQAQLAQAMLPYQYATQNALLGLI